MSEETLNTKLSIEVTAIRFTDAGIVECNDTPEQANSFKVELHNSDLDHPFEIDRFTVGGNVSARQRCQEAFTYASQVQRYTQAAAIGSGLPASWHI